jgi:hypothetical protein
MAKRIQGSSDADAEALEELPDDADRALGIIRAKLDDRLSVEYTVNKLIQEATEVTHLARIFSGESLLPLSRGSILGRQLNFDSRIRLATLLLRAPGGLLRLPRMHACTLYTLSQLSAYTCQVPVASLCKHTVLFLAALRR